MRHDSIYEATVRKMLEDCLRDEVRSWKDWDTYINAPPGTIFRFGKIPSVVQIIVRTPPTALWETF